MLTNQENVFIYKNIINLFSKQKSSNNQFMIHTKLGDQYLIWIAFLPALPPYQFIAATCLLSCGKDMPTYNIHAIGQAKKKQITQT